MSGIEDPGADFSGSGPVEFKPTQAAPVGKVHEVLANEEQRLLSIPGVLSVGVGFGAPGAEVLVVGVVDAGVRSRVPSEVDGVAVVVVVSGPIEALHKP